MLVIPAIDLKNGQCVRLRQGLMDQATVYGEDPAAMARRWQEAGAQWLHVVDLDGAFNKKPTNDQAVEKIRQSIAIPMQLGGGLRTLAHLEMYLAMGIDRLILGTSVLKDRDMVVHALERFPGRIAIALDAREGRLASEGWVETSGTDAVEVAQILAPLEPAAFIYTDIKRDGMQTGPNIAATKRLAQAVAIPVIASGGVATIKDIEDLLPLRKDGVIGVITGKALYAGTLDFQAALQLTASLAKQ
ncbi:1-(5-phosphoribosyl)-5-[(5-phosphoribosylamino)methylideneamino]imidazole-4-carboxamide isomerase [Desulfobacca acetoxidans]|uniref:1-(5-phosphoribosyl)-5-[(5-phosphoribosylamino)methylideneamino] imidazole-4-carboxamide isomerase n=1 Tax=Desulfobacca acetoxidans (strain ATCC 700848 / DSM 11109 / ASRB2) TaxID=880072 RepID=F2NFG7_DESAR|nr:1-(5-phosphoribosyl)-5-[(5-phosphoribosylamino)methylideneamino]imidazole-4-carboxamide isomerase [Desulfobacca acetoxidans]AEB10086.1 1-(5-phosphoribosyl)-5-((5- phosphoribosylamino)methylideneamino) imidazole-4-carboxamide isomerase [Desulfobacca acetoxidans DSM 11109]